MPPHISDEQRSSLNILFIASEADPYIKVGGLGDVAGSLPKAISNLPLPNTFERKIDIRLAIPYYDQVKSQAGPVQFITSYTIDSIQTPVKVEIYSTNLSGLTTYLVSGEPILRNTAVYGTDFKADAEKFIFFSLACLALPHALGWPVDILHANDWHTSVAVHSLKMKRKRPLELSQTHSILTVHNLPFMGAASEDGLQKFKVPFSKNRHLPIWGKSQPLPMGLAATDQIVAVSPTYANEILTPEYGCDLQDFLKTRKSHLSGILNGIDTQYWDPSTDQQIGVNFNVRQINKRKQNKTTLQAEFNLPQDEDIPLMILISRMDPQKGIDIAIESLRLIKDFQWQAILLGTGVLHLEKACRDLALELPEKVRAAIQFNARLSRRMYAGADILMMPSRYEPCGLAQMIGMRYGCIPVARATGGLVDTITDELAGENATGFLFSTAEPVSFSRAMLRAIDTYNNKNRWHQLMTNAMHQDFSWNRSAIEYLNLYSSLTLKKL